MAKHGSWDSRKWTLVTNHESCWIKVQYFTNLLSLATSVWKVTYAKRSNRVSDDWSKNVLVFFCDFILPAVKNIASRNTGNPSHHLQAIFIIYPGFFAPHYLNQVDSLWCLLTSKKWKTTNLPSQIYYSQPIVSNSFIQWNVVQLISSIFTCMIFSQFRMWKCNTFGCQRGYSNGQVF